MAKRKPKKSVKRTKPGRADRKSGSKPATRKTRAARPLKRSAPKRRLNAAKRTPTAKAPVRALRLGRERRTLDDVVQSPPSSLNMDRHGSAARSGRADIEHQRRNHTGMSESITGGDVDVDVEDAYFTGDEAPGGDNPSPDLEVVDDIGRALGVQYDDTEELKGSDKIAERDKHRWEFDPASAEDYKDRK